MHACVRADSEAPKHHCICSNCVIVFIESPTDSLRSKACVHCQNLPLGGNENKMEMIQAEGVKSKHEIKSLRLLGNNMTELVLYSDWGFCVSFVAEGERVRLHDPGL